MLSARVHLLRCARRRPLTNLDGKLWVRTAVVGSTRNFHMAPLRQKTSGSLYLRPLANFVVNAPCSSVRFLSDDTATFSNAEVILETPPPVTTPVVDVAPTEPVMQVAVEPDLAPVVEVIPDLTPEVTTEVPPEIIPEVVPVAIEEKTIVDLADIPEPPPAPIEEVVPDVLNALGEPTFASIGLGGWSPVGMVQQCMEFLHITWDLPWWAAIALGTVVVRTMIFPLVIIAQRNGAKMNNYLPQLQVLQLKMTEARQTGNAIESARYAQEMMMFMKEKDLNPLKNMIVPLAQAPLFISFFMGLRSMANTPVESMREGGLLWFTDLTLADPTFLLPVITSATLFLTIEIGTDSARLTAQNMQTMKYILRALPIIIFPFTMNFPAAILTYWACSNFISLGQVAILKIPAVRQYFRIEKLVTHNVENLPIKKKGFIKGLKESWSNMKITRELEERQRLDEIRFAKAGKGPIIKTYKYDPTQPRPLQAKAKENS